MISSICSPKLAVCASDLCYPCPDSALGFEAVCHLLASALACWPVYGWTPGLFHFLFDNLHTTSVLALGPKETCSLLCLLVFEPSYCIVLSINNELMIEMSLMQFFITFSGFLE